MKIVNVKRFGAGIFAILLTLTTLVSVQAQIISIQEAEESDDFEILATYDYTVSWDTEYRNALVSNKVAVDSNGDVIAVGTNGLNGVIVKFSGIDGSVIWDLIITESFIEAEDSDFDGMPDYWESEYNLNPNVDDAQNDQDLDGLCNIQELFHGTNPTNYDSDDDGLSDSEEVTLGEDGYETNPNNADSDNDQLTDGAEYFQGSNPNDPYELPWPYGVIKEINNQMNIPDDIQLSFYDVAVDSSDNIIVIGMVIYEPHSEEPLVDSYVVKYDSDGNRQWDKLIDEGRWDYGMGVNCDSDDNIFITGGSFALLPFPHLKGWVIKLGKNAGVTHWKKTSDINTIPQPLYFDVDTNFDDDVYSAGIFLDIDWDQQIITSEVMIVTKRDGAIGIKLAQKIISHNDYDCSAARGIKIGNDDSVFISGAVYQPYHQEIVKLSSDLSTTIWMLTDNNEVEGDIYDIDLMSNGDVVASTDELDNFNTWIWDGETGSAFLLHIVEGGGVDQHGYPIKATIWYGGGCAVDADDNIVTTGMRIYTYPMEHGFFYTMKYEITSGSSWYCFSESQYYEEIIEGYLGPSGSS